MPKSNTSFDDLVNQTMTPESIQRSDKMATKLRKEVSMTTTTNENINRKIMLNEECENAKKDLYRICNELLSIESHYYEKHQLESMKVVLDILINNNSIDLLDIITITTSLHASFVTTMSLLSKPEDLQNENVKKQFALANEISQLTISLKNIVRPLIYQ